MKKQRGVYILDLISSIQAVGMALIPIGFSFLLYRKGREDSAYIEIDRQYADLLKIAMGNPDLRDVRRTSSYIELSADENFRREYEIYAYMCWNLIETMFDRQYSEKSKYKISKDWSPVMLEENRIHYEWYKHNINLFKPEFQRFVIEKLMK